MIVPWTFKNKSGHESGNFVSHLISSEWPLNISCRMMKWWCMLLVPLKDLFQIEVQSLQALNCGRPQYSKSVLNPRYSTTSSAHQVPALVTPKTITIFDEQAVTVDEPRFENSLISAQWLMSRLLKLWVAAHKWVPEPSHVGSENAIWKT